MRGSSPSQRCCVLVLIAMPTESRARRPMRSPQPGASASQHDHSGAAWRERGDATSRHGGMQHGGESQAEMMWSMYTDLGNRAYQHGLYGEAEKTFKSALKEARTFGPADRRLGAEPEQPRRGLPDGGRFVESEQLAREGLALRESAFGPNDASVADSLNTLALVRHAQGHPARGGSALPACARDLGADARPEPRPGRDGREQPRDRPPGPEAAGRGRVPPAALARDPRERQRSRPPGRGPGARCPGRGRARAGTVRGGGDGEPPGGRRSSRPRRGPTTRAWPSCSARLADGYRAEGRLDKAEPALPARARRSGCARPAGTTRSW